MTVPSCLDDVTLAGLRATAAADAGPFVDPALVRGHAATALTVPLWWLERVLGRTPPSRRCLTWPEMVLVAAAAADAEHLDYIRAAERHDEDTSAYDGSRELRAAEKAWEALRATLPVPVYVSHNWTIGHYPGYVVGADHIVTQAPLAVGRIRRDTRQALCETPAVAARTGSRGLPPPRALDRSPDGDNQPERLPTCQACLKVARRLATLTSTQDAPLVGSEASTPKGQP